MTHFYFFLHKQDVDVLYKTLKGNTFVVGLNLVYNVIGDEGAKYLGQLLQVNIYDLLISILGSQIKNSLTTSYMVLSAHVKGKHQ